MYSLLGCVYSGGALYRQSRERPVLADSLVSFTVTRGSRQQGPRTTSSLLRTKVSYFSFEMCCKQTEIYSIEQDCCPAISISTILCVCFFNHLHIDLSTHLFSAVMIILSVATMCSAAFQIFPRSEEKSQMGLR